MWSDMIIGSGVLVVVAAISKWQHVRMEKALYRPNGQTNYVPRTECGPIQETFCEKIDEVKVLIIDLDRKREAAKDDYHKEQQDIAVRLAGIEAKLP